MSEASRTVRVWWLADTLEGSVQPVHGYVDNLGWLCSGHGLEPRIHPPRSFWPTEQLAKRVVEVDTITGVYRPGDKSLK